MDGKYIKAAFKVFLVIAIAALVMQAVSFGIYWYSRKNFAQSDHIVKEREKCERVIQGEGDLTELSYCIRFLEWVKANEDPNK
ncbi:hypothetical protein ACFL0C_01420 [Patescibacteria group bacterium]